MRHGCHAVPARQGLLADVAEGTLRASPLNTGRRRLPHGEREYFVMFEIVETPLYKLLGSRFSRPRETETRPGTETAALCFRRRDFQYRARPSPASCPSGPIFLLYRRRDERTDRQDGIPRQRRIFLRRIGCSAALIRHAIERRILTNPCQDEWSGPRTAPLA